MPPGNSCGGSSTWAPSLEKCKQVSDFHIGQAGVGGGVRREALKSPFVPQEGVIWANTHSHSYSQATVTPTQAPLSSESRGKALFLRSVLCRSSPGPVWGRVLRTPRSLPCPRWPLESCPNVPLSSGRLSEFLPTATLSPTSKFPHQYVLLLQFHLESEQFFLRLFLVA